MSKEIVTLSQLHHIEICTGFTDNCGISELAGINRTTAIQALTYIDIRDKYSRCFIFAGTSANGRRNAAELASEIDLNGLGEVIGPARFSNYPYSRHQEVYVWVRNKSHIKKLQTYIKRTVSYSIKPEDFEDYDSNW